jgi:hypothetical protein
LSEIILAFYGVLLSLQALLEFTRAAIHAFFNAFLKGEFGNAGFRSKDVVGVGAGASAGWHALTFTPSNGRCKYIWVTGFFGRGQTALQALFEFIVFLLAQRFGRRKRRQYRQYDQDGKRVLHIYLHIDFFD